MKKTIYSLVPQPLLLGMLLMGLVACHGYALDNDNPTFTKNFTIDGNGALDVTTSGGRITVEGVDGNQVVVRAFVRKQGRVLSASDPIVQRLDEKIKLTMEQTGSTVVARAERVSKASMWNNKISVSFSVTVPHEMACTMKTSGGSLMLSNVNGTQELKTSGGSIKMHDISGTVVAATSGGSIKVERQKGDMDVRTSGGSIKIADATGNINGKTSGGSISLQNISGEVDVRTSGGGIKIEGRAAGVTAATSGGGITAKIQDLSKSLNLRTSGGSIRVVLPQNLGLDLDLKANKVDIALENFSGEAKRGKVVGAMRGGGIPVSMATSGGGIDVDFQ